MATRKIETELALTGEKQFNDQLKSANNNLKTLKSDMALLTDEFRDNADSSDALQKKQGILKAQLEQQEEVVAALTARHKQAVEAYGEDAAATDRYKRELNAATIKLHSFERALADNEDALEGSEDAAEDAEEAVEDYGRAVQKAADKADNAERSFEGVGAGIGAVTMAAGKGLLAMSGLALGGFAVMGKAALAAAEAGDPAFESLNTNVEGLKASAAKAQAAVGSILLPTLNSLSTDGAKLLEDFSAEMEAAGGDTEKQAAVMGDYIGKAVGLIKEQLPEMMELGGTLIGALGSAVIDAAPELLEAGLPLLDQLLTGIEDAAPALGPVALGLVFGLVSHLLEHAPDMLVAGIDLLTSLIMGIGEAAPNLVPTALDVIGQLVVALISNAPMLITAGIKLLFGLLQGLLEGVPQLLSNVPAMVQQIAGKFREALPEMTAIGQEAIKGLWQGMVDFKDWLWGKITGFGGEMMAHIKSVFGIHSPSKRMADEVGKPNAQGIGVGFVKEMENQKKLMAKAIPTRFGADNLIYMDDYRQVGGAHRIARGKSGTGGTGTVINMYFQPKQLTEGDMRMACRIINEELGEAM